MKQVLICILALLLVLSGCQNNPTPNQTSSVGEEPGSTLSSAPAPLTQEQELLLSAEEEWTWNKLYDYLENPRQSGDFSFNSEEETITLLDADGKTALGNQWNKVLEENMLVMKYNKQGDLIGKYRLAFTGLVSSAPTLSSPTSRPQTNTTPSENQNGSTPQKPKQLLTLFVSGENPALKKAVAAFNKQSKTAELLITTGHPLTAGHLLQLQKQNNCPDLVMLSHREMALARQNKLLINLSGFNSLSSLDPSFTQKTTWGKGVYGLPVGGAVTALACNDELLIRAKATVPKTWEELLENAKLLRDNLTGVTPIGLTTDIADTSNMAQEFNFFLKGLGGTLLTPDQKSTAFYSEEGVKVLEIYETLWQEKLITDYTLRKDFYNQTVGYGIVSSADYEKTFGKKAKANFTAAPLVAPRGGEAVSALDLYSFCIPSTCSQEAKKEVYAFLTFFYENPIYSVDLCQNNGWVPALLKAREDKAYQTEAWQVFMDAAKTAATPPTIGCYPTLETYLAECVSSVLAGTDKETALEKAWNKVENRLARE